MSTAKTIAGIVPGLQATALMGYNLGEMDFDLKPSKKRKKKNGAKRMVRMGVTNLISIPLIGASASAVNALD